MSELTPTGFIPFTSDYGFKVTFGNEKNTVFLKRALQALLQLPYPISEITFSRATFEGLQKESRSGIYDMVCVDERGNTFIVEMQSIAKSFFLNRLQFYAFQRFDSLVKKGKFDFDIKEKIYCIAFLGSNISTVETYHNTLSLKNQDGIEFDNPIRYVTVELDKFDLTVDKVKTDLEKLVFTIKNAHVMVATEAAKPTFWEEDWLSVPLGELDIRTMSPEKYEAYQYWLVHDAEAKRLEDELKAEGKIEGKIEEKTLMIKELIKEGLIPISSIARIGRVSEEFVWKIKEELDKEKGEN
jgi:predicted transposase/invertase (TIGR01784 family)